MQQQHMAIIAVEVMGCIEIIDIMLWKYVGDMKVEEN